MAFVTLVAGPPLLRWGSESRRSPPPPPGSSAVPVARAAGPAAPPSAEPGAVSRAEGPGAAASREALLLYQQGRIAEACDRYADAARAAGDPAARRNLGACLARLGRDAYQAGQAAVAAEHYQRATDADPEDPQLWTALATAQAKAGSLGRAQAVLEQALARFGDDPEALYLLAQVQEEQGRTRDAVGTLRRLLAASPGHARGRTLLASLDREQKVEGGYWAQESAHFLVRYEGAQGIDLGRSVVDTLEEAYASIGHDLDTYPPDKVQVGIYAAPVFGDLIGAPPHLIAGAYDGRKLRLNLSASRAYSRDLSRLVRHEYTHLLIHLASAGHAPTWLHEGLAQAMEPRSAPRLLAVSVPREYLTLPGIERLSRTADPAALVAGYGLTHVAVEFLLDQGGLSSMRDLLRRLGRDEPLPQALRAAFGFGPEAIEGRLLAAGGKG